MTTAFAQTDRLLLRTLSFADAEVLLDIRAQPDVARWMVDTDPWSDLGQAHAAIARWEDEHRRGDGLGTWAVQPHTHAQPVGTVGLHEIPDSQGEIEIGWVLHPSAWGHGYAREAAGLVMRYATELGLPRIWALMWPGNEPSARVCRALGMVDLGVRPDPWYGGESHMFSIDLNPES